MCIPNSTEVLALSSENKELVWKYLSYMDKCYEYQAEDLVFALCFHGSS